MTFRNIMENKEKNKDFFRIPEKVINNEFYVLQKDIPQMYKVLKSGDDLNIDLFNKCKKLLDKIDKSITKNK